MYVLNLDPETNRILSAAIMPHPPIGAVLVDELPDGDVTEWLYVDGRYVHDPLPEPEPAEPEKTLEERTKELEEMVGELMAGVQDTKE